MRALTDFECGLVGGAGGADVDGYYPDGTPVSDFYNGGGYPNLLGGGAGAPQTTYSQSPECQAMKTSVDDQTLITLAAAGLALVAVGGGPFVESAALVNLGANAKNALDAKAAYNAQCSVTLRGPQ